jgi:plastocyanin
MWAVAPQFRGVGAFESNRILICLVLVDSDLVRSVVKRRYLIVLIAVAAMACNGESTDTTAAAGGGEERIEIADLAFNPDELTIAAGTTVTWENTDASLPHTSNSDDEVWESGTLNEGDEFSFTFEEAGTFAYFCQVHPTMTGTIVVE